MVNENRSLVRTKGCLLDMLDKMKEDILAVMSKKMDLEQIFKAVTLAASRNDKIYECTQLSVALSVMCIAESGLDAGGYSGEAYIVPFWNGKRQCREAVFIPGYPGLIKICVRSGACSMIDVQLVYEEDFFELDLAADRPVTHKPELRKERGDCIGAWSLAYLNNAPKPLVEWMRTEDINAIKDRAKRKEGGPWDTDWGQMARKTVIRRIFHYIPKSVAANQEIEAATRMEDSKFGLLGLPNRMPVEPEPDPFNQPDPPKPEAEPEPMAAPKAAFQAVYDKLAAAAKAKNWPIEDFEAKLEDVGQVALALELGVDLGEEE
jgi:recombination protein RecT